MEIADILDTVRNAKEICEHTESLKRYGYFSIAFVLVKGKKHNPDLSFLCGAATDEDDLTILEEQILIEDIDCKAFCKIATIIYENYSTNFSPIISRLLLKITDSTDTYENLLKIANYCNQKDYLGRSELGFRISFDI